MRKSNAWGQACGCMLAALLWSSQVSAVSTGDEDSLYFGAGASHVWTDGSRPNGDGEGYQLMVGVPAAWESWAFELSFFDNSMKDRAADGGKDYQTGLFLDVVKDFGFWGWENGLKLKPYLLGGVSVIEEDVLSDKHHHAGISLGGGALFPLPWYGLGVRTEARAVGQSNDESAPGHDFLTDYRFLVGLQLPLRGGTRASAPEPEAEPLPPPADCEIAVVDPISGRSDCAVDTDGDGVYDPDDNCPGTPAGTRVDAFGCAVPPVEDQSDQDEDGVFDSEDVCPDTMAPAKVDDRGCALPQPLVLPDFTFEFDSNVLTPIGREYLDRMAAMMRGQTDLTIEIIGHTDSRGTEAYNLQLSTRRAVSAKEYLVSQGVNGERLTTSGRGENQPVATNETEEGRSLNRRVAFWLYVR